MQMVAYLFETWLQFDDWWFDVRVPLRKPGLTSIPISEDFLSHAYTAWTLARMHAAALCECAIHVQSRTVVQSDSEHFAVQYIVWTLFTKPRRT